MKSTGNYYRFYICLCFVFCFSCHAQAQYFQQEVNYKIDVRLDDVKHELHAFETFEYVNNSPDVLNEIFIHLWPNAYKNKNTALFRQFYKKGYVGRYFISNKALGYIDSLNFNVDGATVKMIPDSVNPDICRIILKNPLAPGGRITVSTPFHVKLPSAKISRMGHLGQAYAITQWYPKPAVYDAKGWHAIPYLNQGEFYSEFGSFEVSITLPRNYVVGATGDLQNEEELMWLTQKASETDALTTFEKKMDFPPSDPTNKTLVFKQSKVHDFAWFADKRYHVLKGSVTLPHSQEKVTTWAMFTNSEPNLWKKSISYINNAIYYYSLWNGDYAYKQCTAVDGTISAGTGMEYPNITIIGKSGNDFILENVIVHEVGHNWFYGMLGNNERDHGWMDEGVNTANEIRYFMQQYGADTCKVKSVVGNLGAFGKLTGFNNLNSSQFAYFEYLYSARKRTDQPIDIPSVKFSETNYGTIMYSKTGLGFEYLHAYLGTNVYDSCMKEYFRLWKFRHPYPEDMRKVFTDVSGKNLDWFFKDYLQTNKKTDYKISSLQRIYGDSFINPIAKGYVLKIKNKGGITAPFSVSSLKDNKILGTKWYEGFQGTDTIRISCEHCHQLKIDALEVMPDLNRKNNIYRTEGILKGVKKFSFPFLLRLENPDRTQISWLPAAGWNNYDKTMLGLALHNISATNKKFEFALAPMYSTGTDKLSGTGKVNYTMYPAIPLLHSIMLSLGGSQFAYKQVENFYSNEENNFIRLHYQKVSGELFLRLKNRHADSDWNKSISFRHLNIFEEQVNYVLNDTVYKPVLEKFYHYHSLANITIRKKSAIDPLAVILSVEQGKNYVKSSMEFLFRVSYKIINRGVDFRFFTQGLLLNKNSGQNVHLTGTGKGFGSGEDYLYENIYFGRSEYEGILSRQFYHQAGDFKIYSPIGRNDLWIGTFNIKAHFPGRLPFRAYLDIGMYDGSKRAYEDYKGLTYDAGLSLCLAQDLLEVYFPIFHSKDIKRYLEVNEIKFKDQIRFVFNINALGPFKLRETILNF